MLFRIIGAVVILLVVVTLAAWDQHYRLPSEQFEETKRLAELLCTDRRGQLPEEAFSTDGCTLFPNNWGGEYGHCCIRHDVDYWCGGTKEDRLTSDGVFAECVKKENPSAATIMHWSSWLLSQPLFPAPWRWGYGFEYPGGYDQEEVAISTD